MTRLHSSDFPMTDAQRRIERRSIERTIRHHEQAETGLGYCPKCDHEYTEAQVENIDFDRAPVPYISQCPNCHTEEERILYWCKTLPLHKESDCEKIHES